MLNSSHSKLAFTVGWHHRSKLAHVVSVAREHRTFPRNLPSELRQTFTFPSLARNPHLQVFQFVLGVDRSLYAAPGRLTAVPQPEPRVRPFDTADIMWVGSDGKSVRTLHAKECSWQHPRSTGWVIANSKARFIDVVARCAYIIGDDQEPLLLDHPKNQASFVVWVGGKSIFYPLAEVLHLSHAESFINITARYEADSPSALWGGDGPRIVRAAGADAMPRVAALTKRFSWSADDELWLMWTLDTVGVDHVLLEVCTTSLDLAKVQESIARHTDLAERVTLIDTQIPTDMTTFEHLFIGRLFDHFLRWQADFDYLLVIDTDEFLQMFDTSAPSHPRIDIKTLIALERDNIAQEGQIHFMRPFVRRSQPDSPPPDDHLASFLARLGRLNGKAMHRALDCEIHDRKTDQGKALFNVAASLNPYLHFNQGWHLPKRDSQQRFLFHVRHKPDRGSRSMCNWTLPGLARAFAEVTPR
jgi:hypothetical protein